MIRLGLAGHNVVMQIAIVLGLLIAGVVLFSLETFSVEVTTLALLIGLVAFQILSPEQAFSGFSSDIIIILASIFIITGALQRSGLVSAIAHRLFQFSGRSSNRFLLILMSGVGALSAFMNNTTVTALFVAPVLSVSKKLKISPSKLLMPLAYASILGGTCTLIGTSTNMAVSGYMNNIGLPPVGLFETTRLGLMILAIGIVYVLVIGKRLLPDHPDESLTEDYNIREYLSEIIVVPGSHMIGQRIFESDLAKMEFQIVALWRGDNHLVPAPETTIRAGDVLLVKAKSKN